MQGSHILHDCVNFTQTVQKPPSVSFRFWENEHRGIPRAISWDYVALGKLLFHKGLESAKFLDGYRPLFLPYGHVRQPINAWVVALNSGPP